jgi:hypothetical protein
MRVPEAAIWRRDSVLMPGTLKPRADQPQEPLTNPVVCPSGLPNS